ncbi:MAG: signal peptidase I [Cryobacterium sp.]|nr:signal peptidase I [Oligoflexia bacterium]
MKYLWEQIWQLAVALLIVFAIRSAIVEPFKIPSGSMIPTLYVGDFIFVNKFAYGLKLPFSDYFGAPIQLIHRDPPKHGEVIVFLYPREPDTHYIKRVIGVPGDTVEVRNKVVYINGAPLPQTEAPTDETLARLKDIGDPRYGDDHMKLLREKIEGGHEHLILTDSNNDYTQNFEPAKIPENFLFVMGDNRDFSNDSRFWGLVPFENISGRAEVIWLSMWFDLKDTEKNSFKPGRIGTLLK